MADGVLAEAHLQLGQCIAGADDVRAGDDDVAWNVTCIGTAQTRWRDAEPLSMLTSRKPCPLVAGISFALVVPTRTVNAHCNCPDTLTRTLPMHPAETGHADTLLGCTAGLVRTVDARLKGAEKRANTTPSMMKLMRDELTTYGVRSSR